MDDKIRTRIEKLIGMLTSDFEGERATASAMLTKMAKEAKQTLPEFLAAFAGKTGGSAGAKPSGSSRRPIWDDEVDYAPPQGDDLAALRYVQQYPGVFSDWEVDFAGSVLQWHKTSATLSERQEVSYQKLKKKVEFVSRKR